MADASESETDLSGISSSSNTSGMIGFLPPDDFDLSDDLVYGTLFMQVLLWNFLLFMLAYDLMLIVCGKFFAQDDQAILYSRTSHTLRREDSEDGMHYLVSTLLCLVFISVSLVGIVNGWGIAASAFLMVVPVTCVISINTTLDTEFTVLKKFFGNEMLDMVANILLILVEAVASIITAVYVYQLLMTRYAWIVATFWPPKLDFGA